MFRGLKYNGSGYLDLTAYQAIINIYKNSGGNKAVNKERNSKGSKRKDGCNEYCKNEKYGYTDGCSL